MSALEPWLREIVRCPACRGELGERTAEDGTTYLDCLGECGATGPGRSYRVDDGIPVLLVDEAVPTRP